MLLGPSHFIESVADRFAPEPGRSEESGAPCPPRTSGLCFLSARVPLRRSWASVVTELIVSTRGEESRLRSVDFVIFVLGGFFSYLLGVSAGPCFLCCKNSPAEAAPEVPAGCLSLRCPTAASRGWNFTLQLLDLKGPNRI